MKHVRTAGLAAAVATAALVLAACGSSGGSTGASAPSPSPTASVAALTAAQLPTALLTLADMPAGYKQDPATTDNELTLSGCAAVDKLITRTKGEASKDVSFTAAESGPFVGETLNVMQDKNVKAEFAEGQAAFNACPTITVPGEGTDPDVTLKLTSAPVTGLGDEAFGIKGAATVQGVPVALEINYIRVGGNLIEVDNLAFGTVDSTLTTTTSQKAVAKVKSTQSA